ncbi:hypothetical protein VUR80DRAFT_89 [Thermomyces stellatus]
MMAVTHRHLSALVRPKWYPTVTFVPIPWFSLAISPQHSTHRATVSDIVLVMLAISLDGLGSGLQLPSKNAANLGAIALGLHRTLGIHCQLPCSSSIGLMDRPAPRILSRNSLATSFTFSCSCQEPDRSPAPAQQTRADVRGRRMIAAKWLRPACCAVSLTQAEVVWAGESFPTI